MTQITNEEYRKIANTQRISYSNSISSLLFNITALRANRKLDTPKTS